MKQIRNYGLIGNPIKHSLSPLMHNAAFAKLKINARYKLFELKERDVFKFLNNIPKKNIFGLNVTIPYKETVVNYPFSDKNSSVASIGAANTIKVDKSGKLKLFNTDYLGFIRHIEELRIKPKNVAIIGAGGASKAICFALGKKKVREVVIYDIDKFRSLALMKKFNQVFLDSRFKAVANIEELNLKDKDLLINASSVGLKTDDPLLISASMLHQNIFVYDLIYNPKETKLLKLARENNIRYSNGLGMLLYQGVESLNIWISPKKAPVDIMRLTLEKACLKITG